MARASSAETVTSPHLSEPSTVGKPKSPSALIARFGRAHRGSMGRRARLAACVALVAGCAGADGDLPASSEGRLPTTSHTMDDPTAGDATPTVRLAFVGDVMLGRKVADVVAADPGSVFERLRPALAGADLGFGNLESPLTARPHVTGDYALEADPTGAALLAAAGFDVLDVANNHAMDAGPHTVLDTTEALEAAGLRWVGGGTDAERAAEPLLIDVEGITIGALAFDLTGGAAATATQPGVNSWDRARAEAAVGDLRDRVDIVVVGLHGGIEYLPRPDPSLDHIAALVAGWGVDVVWGHGAHVAYPVEIAATDDRQVVIASGLGNALFDQTLPGTDEGTLVEVLADADGVLAMRTGSIAIDGRRSEFTGWHAPAGDAAALDGDWWSPVRPWTPAVSDSDAGWNVTTIAAALPDGAVVVDVATGDVTGAGEIDTVVAYRRPATEHPVHDRYPSVDWTDADGRSAHLAVYTSDGRMRWGSAFLFSPVAHLAVCTGAIAVTFDELGSPTVGGGGAWLWDGFGFRTAAQLPGPATPTCADIDSDGRLDPVLTRPISDAGKTAPPDTNSTAPTETSVQ